MLYDSILLALSIEDVYAFGLPFHKRTRVHTVVLTHLSSLKDKQFLNLHRHSCPLVESGTPVKLSEVRAQHLRYPLLTGLCQIDAQRHASRELWLNVR